MPEIAAMFNIVDSMQYYVSSILLTVQISRYFFRHF